MLIFDSLMAFTFRGPSSSSPPADATIAFGSFLSLLPFFFLLAVVPSSTQSLSLFSDSCSVLSSSSVCDEDGFVINVFCFALFLPFIFLSGIIQVPQPSSASGVASREGGASSSVFGLFSTTLVAFFLPFFFLLAENELNPHTASSFAASGSGSITGSEPSLGLAEMSSITAALSSMAPFLSFFVFLPVENGSNLQKSASFVASDSGSSTGSQAISELTNMSSIRTALFFSFFLFLALPDEKDHKSFSSDFSCSGAGSGIDSSMMAATSFFFFFLALIIKVRQYYERTLRCRTMLMCLLRIRADATVPGEQNPSDAQVPQASVYSSTSPMACRGRGRPPRSRTAITVYNAV